LRNTRVAWLIRACATAYSCAWHDALIWRHSHVWHVCSYVPFTSALCRFMRGIHMWDFQIYMWQSYVWFAHSYSIIFVAFKRVTCKVRLWRSHVWHAYAYVIVIRGIHIRCCHVYIHTLYSYVAFTCVTCISIMSYSYVAFTYGVVMCTFKYVLCSTT